MCIRDRDDIVSPAKLVPGIPVSVEKIVLKCTQKRTERRYQTMSDLIAVSYTHLDVYKRQVIEGEELLARAICHELAHLDGHL